MRSILIGCAMALAFIAAIFAGPYLLPHAPPPTIADIVKPGYTGALKFGAWVMVCPKDKAAGDAKTPIPFTLVPAPPGGTAPTAGQDQLGRCRTGMAYPGKDNKPAMVVVFRSTEGGTKLVMIVRFPAWAKKGDEVGVRANGKGVFSLKVEDCSQGGCLATGAMTRDQITPILAARRGGLIFPAMQGGKPGGIALPLPGLRQALVAMHLAES